MTLDDMAALRNLVLSDANVFSTTEGRVYVNSIPETVIEAEDPRFPSKMLVLRQAGGSAKADLLPIENVSLTAFCYGEDDFEADKVLRAVVQFFLYFKRKVVDGVLFHHFTATGGTELLVDPDIVWHGVQQGFTFMADTKEA